MPTPSDAPIAAPSASNLGFVEDLYFAWLQDPASVDERWRAYFETLPPGAGRGAGAVDLAGPCAPRRPAPRADDREAFRLRVDRLVNAWRTFGHLQADLDPLGLERRRAERLDLAEFGLDRGRPRPAGAGAGGRRRHAARARGAARGDLLPRPSASSSATSTTASCAAGSSSGWSGPATGSRWRRR